MNPITERTIAAMKQFAKMVEANEPIPVTILTRESTPDGPLTQRHHVTLRPSEMGTDAVSRAIEEQRDDGN